MTVDEIFARLAAHMRIGIEMHNDIANGFGFLNLRGYSKCHEYHFYEESRNYRCLQAYYLNHYYKIISNDNVEKIQIIPSNWYKYSSDDVDINTKQKAIKELTKKWVEWEKETKKLFETTHKELYELGEIAAALQIQAFLLDVTEELRWAHEKLLNLESMNYDMPQIIAEQEQFFEKYNTRMIENDKVSST